MKLRNIGMGSIFDLFPRRRTTSLSFREPISDEEVMRSDWQAVGDDLRAAMKEMDKEIERRTDES